MARQVVVLALIFAALVVAAMAGDAPSESPKASTASPKASPAAASGSPATSPASPTEDKYSPPAPGSEYSDDSPVDFGSPSLAPVAADLFPAADLAPLTSSTSGASALKVSAAVVAIAGLFAF